ncbi:hypothetical protein C9374_006125 [Naegleria lovaniensis]|uniref:PARP16 N-terminal domain-containing protein n=1 Tax=Naegleria lovaniensis TaxID=51637 RepID=A0AA88KMR2_NAELO|nr:uncharacterized protein C9374_006125 [Naegleria lovaniensis]KAG2381741.1 hypothetical protein C9374_006125 [Naegleria lovaniensis]
MAQYHQSRVVVDNSLEQVLNQKTSSSSLTISRETYDLYCCLLNSAAHSHRSESILTPFPSAFIKNSRKDYDRLREVLSVMPSCDKVFVEPFCQDGNNITFTYNTDEDLSQSILELMRHAYKNQEKISLEELRDAFEFILKKQHNKKFEVHYVSYQQYLKSNNKPLLLKPDHIFELRYRNNDFDHSSTDFYTGFHGSSIENFFSIITNSLQNMSGTSQMKTGNAFGDGVYLCEDLRVARDFSKGGVISWANSKLGSHLSAVVQCKVVGKKEYAMKTSSSDENRYLIVQNSGDLRIQYVLIFSHFKDENELKRSHNFSRGMIYFYIILLIAVIVGNYWKDIKRELKRFSS